MPVKSLCIRSYKSFRVERANYSAHIKFFCN